MLSKRTDFEKVRLFCSGPENSLGLGHLQGAKNQGRKVPREETVEKVMTFRLSCAALILTTSCQLHLLIKMP